MGHITTTVDETKGIGSANRCLTEMNRFERIRGTPQKDTVLFLVHNTAEALLAILI